MMSVREEQSLMFNRSIEDAKKVMLINLAGNFCRRYDIGLDESYYVYGTYCFYRLHSKEGGYFQNDAMSEWIKEGRDTIPLDEFRDYLVAWYWPLKTLGTAR